MRTSGQYDFYELSRLADDVSAAAFLVRHEGMNDDIRQLAEKGVQLCEVLERGYDVLRRQKAPASAADVYTAQSVQTLLQNSEVPPISQKFAEMWPRISWAKEKASALAKSTLLPETELRELQAFFGQLSAMFGCQSNVVYRQVQKLRTEARNAEPMRNHSFRGTC
jgi:hypothetical protein